MLSNESWPALQRKRGREEDLAEISPGGTLGFTEHRSKRLQALPLRTSPPSKRWAEPPRFHAPPTTFIIPSQPRTITPNSSDSEEPGHFAFAEEPEIVTVPTLQSPVNVSITMADMDMDMDMMDTAPEPNPNHLNAFQPEPLPSVTGRIPTPIHCSFAAQVRGQNWNEAHGALATTPEEPTSMAFDSNGMVDAAVAHDSNLTTNALAMADWNHIQNRRLPSPISETGGEDSPAMVLDSCCSPHPITTSPSGHLSHLTHEHPLLASMREQSPRPGSPNGGMEVESGSPSPKRGHARSRHTVNSWTAVPPGVKRSFSIGYRADCDKCRMKVPGHFNHIIIS
ncbi:hypothetical protein QC763_403550 [Podospora pseudopauciseta]|uniref:Uncharacterized protein n=2 Tax=Podospora TaxID=5144 RepID=A0ABR0HCX4_9PEZI|nr:hypothetical protein QC763_403550 [Podospora pseudopauciseta]KAK4676879.1 hypothetical protein QC764_403550 [Podospora pseudoanserina]